MENLNKILFCFGQGYCANNLVELLSAKGWVCFGSGRTKNSDKIIFDGQTPIKNFESLAEPVTHILISIPPQNSHGDTVFYHHLKDLYKLSCLKWIGYLSTTGVYGDTSGKKVDESQPTFPSSLRSKRRVEAENNWIEEFQKNQLPIHIFRLPGIYGPGRSVFDQLRAGTAKRIIKPGHKFSRIHVDDIVSCLIASMERPSPGAIYNVCDDHPAAPEEVVTYASKLIETEPPPRIPFELAKLTMTKMALSFWKDNRTVDNSLIKKELNFKLKYPSYREGLAAIYKNERQLGKR